MEDLTWDLKKLNHFEASFDFSPCKVGDLFNGKSIGVVRGTRNVNTIGVAINR